MHWGYACALRGRSRVASLACRGDLYLAAETVCGSLAFGIRLEMVADVVLPVQRGGGFEDDFSSMQWTTDTGRGEIDLLFLSLDQQSERHSVAWVCTGLA